MFIVLAWSRFHKRASKGFEPPLASLGHIQLPTTILTAIITLQARQVDEQGPLRCDFVFDTTHLD